MRLSQKIALHTGIQISGKIASLFVGILSVGIMTRFLGTSGYGDYSTIIAFLSLFGIMADLGLYTLLTREISKNPNERHKIASNIFSIRVISAFLIIGISPVIAFLLPYSREIKIAIFLGTLAFIFQSSAQVLVGIFQKEFKTQVTALSELISRMVFLGLVSWIFYYLRNQSVILLIGALVLSNLLYFLIVFFSSQKLIKVRFKFDKKYWSYILKESFPIAIAIVLNLIYFKIDTIMLSIMKSSSDVGIYGVAYKVLEILIVFPAMFVGTMMPLFSKANAEDKQWLKKIVERSLGFLIISAVPIVVGVFILANPIISLIGGQGFEMSGNVLKILIFAVGIIFIGNLFGHLVVAIGVQKKIVKVYLVGAILNISLNLILIPAYSYIGASVSTVITELVVVILSFFVIKKALGYIPSFGLFGKALLSSIVMGLILYLAGNTTIIILIPLGAIIYISTLYLLGGLPKEILELFKERKV